MATARAERRLAAILAADVVGYSRLVEHDEAGTLSALKVLRREVIDPLLAEHQGRIVKLMGDGALVEFGSVVDADDVEVVVQGEEVAHAPADHGVVVDDHDADGSGASGHRYGPPGIATAVAAEYHAQGRPPGSLAKRRASTHTRAISDR